MYYTHHVLLIKVTLDHYINIWSADDEETAQWITVQYGIEYHSIIWFQSFIPIINLPRPPLTPLPPHVSHSFPSFHFPDVLPELA